VRRTKKKPGPDPLPAKVKRSLSISVPVNEEEKAYIERLAAKEERPVATYIRRLLLRGLKPRRCG